MSPSPQKYLVLDPDPRAPGGEPEPGPGQNPDVVAKVVRTATDAVAELGRSGYDAVLLSVEEPEELSLLPRIKTWVPQIPLVAVVPEGNPDLGAVARGSGADLLLERPSDAGGSSAGLRRVLEETDDFLGRARAAIEEFRGLARKHTELRAEGRKIVDRSFELARISARDFVPLLVEDDPNQALLLSRCFRTAGLPLLLPVMGDGEEAVEYLSGQGRYVDRSAYPIPTLVILDLHLPRKSGLEVLAWIRSRPEVRDLVVIMLSSSNLPEDVGRALDLGADHYFVKPFSPESLSTTAKLIAVRWRLVRGRKSPGNTVARGSEQTPEKQAYPPCPKCDSKRINRIGHEATGTRRWTREKAESATPPQARRLDYVFMCEHCGFSWKAQ